MWSLVFLGLVTGVLVLTRTTPSTTPTTPYTTQKTPFTTPTTPYTTQKTPFTTTPTTPYTTQKTPFTTPTTPYTTQKTPFTTTPTTPYTTSRPSTTPPYTTSTPQTSTTSSYTTSTTQATTHPPSPEPKIWALLVAGSTGWDNYRHQADVCHAYQILRRNGIPDENIIVMMYDDIADNSANPTPGIIINHPGGPNVYEGVLKDYTGEDVTVTNFINILTGNKTALKGIGSGKVIESGPDDTIFLNFVDHGSPGVLYFPDESIYADELIKTISKISDSHKFKKFFLYIEACHAGSLFDSLLPDTTNVFALTAADPFESSYACYFDDKRETYLGDVFSIVWMNDTEHESLPMESVHHQFERVRTFTNTSHIEEYGDLDIGVTKLKDVIGFRMRERYTMGYNPSYAPHPGDDVADNLDVPLIVLEKKMKRETNRSKRRELKMEKYNMVKKRTMVDNMFKEVIGLVAEGNVQREYELRDSHYGLTWSNFPCYKQVSTAFNKICVNSAQSPYVRVHLQKLINMCSVSWLTTSQIIESMHSVCGQPHSLANLIRVF